MLVVRLIGDGMQHGVSSWSCLRPRSKHTTTYIRNPSIKQICVRRLRFVISRKLRAMLIESVVSVVWGADVHAATSATAVRHKVPSQGGRSAPLSSVFQRQVHASAARHRHH